MIKAGVLHWHWSIALQLQYCKFCNKAGGRCQQIWRNGTTDWVL